jgi:FkbM family methyltransferase
MNAAVRIFCQRTPILRDLYRIARGVYNQRRFSARAGEYFSDVNEYRKAIELEDGKVVELRAKNGLIFTLRRNRMDAAILSEIFLDRCYVEDLKFSETPTVVDIGGYIGDSALFAVKHLNARKVVVCEPSQRNWTLLQKNVSNNHYDDRIVMVNKAVTGRGESIKMNIDAPDRAQARVSAYGPVSGEMQEVPGITLADLMAEHQLTGVDLLKMDCEGGEYEILSTLPQAVLKRIRNIVFEFHEIDDFQAKLDNVKQRLTDDGFVVKTRSSLVFAARA